MSTKQARKAAVKKSQGKSHAPKRAAKAAPRKSSEVVIRARPLDDEDDFVNESVGGLDLEEGAELLGQPTGPIKEDPILDRRIIEGMLNDRKGLMEELAKEGMTSAAVLRRAAELGISEALLRQVKGVAADLAGERPGRRPAPSTLGARTCLSCDRVFLSTGPGNRLCMRCRGGDAGLAQW